MRLTVKVANLPAPHYGGWSYAPGAFGWTQDGFQWVLINNPAGNLLGRAGFHEVGDALFVEVRFDLERVPAGAFPRTLPDDPAEARRRMNIAGGFQTKTIRKDEKKQLITRAEVLTLTLSGRDPDGATIGAMLDARVKEQDDWN